MGNISKWQHIVVLFMILAATLSLLLAACGPLRLSGSAGQEDESSTSTPTPTDEISTLPPLVELPAPTLTPTPTATQAGPELVLSVLCGDNLQAVFRITNDGGDMFTPGTYTVTDPGTGASTSSALQLAAGAQISFTAAGNAQLTLVYAATAGDSRTLHITGACIPQPTPTRTPTRTNTPTKTLTPTPSRTPTKTRTPTATQRPVALVLTVACDGNLQAVFRITNDGGDMLIPGSYYTVTDPATGHSVNTNNLQIPAGGQVSFTTVGNAQVTLYYVVSANATSLLQATGHCIPQPTLTRTATKTPTRTPPKTPTRTRTPTP